MIKKVLENFKINYDIKYLETYQKHYCENINKIGKPYPHIINFLHKLKSEGFVLSVISNKDDMHLKRVINHHYKNIFDEYLGAKPEYKIKPDPFLVNHLLEKFKIKNENAIFIGDSEVDFLTSKNSNLKFILTAWGFRTLKEMKQYNIKLIAKSVKHLYRLILKTFKINN